MYISTLPETLKCFANSITDIIFEDDRTPVDKILEIVAIHISHLERATKNELYRGIKYSYIPFKSLERISEQKYKYLCLQSKLEAIRSLENLDTPAIRLFKSDIQRLLKCNYSFNINCMLRNIYNILAHVLRFTQRYDSMVRILHYNNFESISNSIPFSDNVKKPYHAKKECIKLLKKICEQKNVTMYQKLQCMHLLEAFILNATSREFMYSQRKGLRNVSTIQTITDLIPFIYGSTKVYCSFLSINNPQVGSNKIT